MADIALVPYPTLLIIAKVVHIESSEPPEYPLVTKMIHIEPMMTNIMHIESSDSPRSH